MPKSLADGHIKLTLLAAPPADKNAVTLTEAAAGEDISCNILASNYALGPTGSETVAEKELCKVGNANAFGPSNYAGNISPFRYFDATTKQPSATEDFAFEGTKEKGTTLYLLERESAKESTEPWAADDEYSYFEVITDDPQRIDLTGYIKRNVPLQVQDAALNKSIVAP